MSTNQPGEHEDDFAMTCPCFVGLSPSGATELIVVDGMTCICLFTDADLVDAFHRAKYGEKADPAGVEVLPAPDRLTLIKLLDGLKPQLSTQGCGHVEIDPGRWQRVLCAAIDDLIGGL